VFHSDPGGDSRLSLMRPDGSDLTLLTDTVAGYPFGAWSPAGSRVAFLSGSFGGTNEYPKVLQAAADVLPLTYLIQLVRDAYLHGESLAHDWKAVAIVVAWGVGGLAVAVRRFGWEPRER